MSAPINVARVPTSLRRELERKALHVTSVAAPLAYAAGVARRPLLVTLTVLLTGAVIVESARQRHRVVREQFARLTGRLLREHEHLRWAGATWMLLAFMLAVLLLPRDIAIAAMWAVSVGDASAAIVGRWFARHSPRQAPTPASHGGGGKTVAGSVACAVATLAGALLVAQLPLGQACSAATLAAVAERPAGPLDDNLRVVCAVGLGILLWRLIFS